MTAAIFFEVAVRGSAFWLFLAPPLSLFIDDGLLVFGCLVIYGMAFLNSRLIWTAHRAAGADRRSVVQLRSDPHVILDSEPQNQHRAVLRQQLSLQCAH